VAVYGNLQMFAWK